MRGDLAPLLLDPRAPRRELHGHRENRQALTANVPQIIDIVLQSRIVFTPATVDLPLMYELQIPITLGTRSSPDSAKSTGVGRRERLGYNGTQGPQMAEETLIQKIRNLPPERVAEVEDFVDFLTVRDQDRHVTQAATRLSEEAFRAVWDNSDDAEYDRL